MIFDRKNYFEGKKITVMGLGLLGRGIGVTRFLAEQEADLLVTDLKTAEELAPALEKLKDLTNIKYVLGEHRLEDFSARGGSAGRGCDILMRAPNAPLDSPYVEEAKKTGVKIKMDASFFAELAPAGVKLIGVTGTRGKSTVTQLVYEIIKKNLQDIECPGDTRCPNVYLAGNIRDAATMPLLKVVKTGDYVVFELDSWQLQGFDEAKISPHVAVFTSFFSDHLNYYKGDTRRYWYDKASIFRYQKCGDKLIVSSQVKDEMEKRGEERQPDSVAYIQDILDWNIKMRGSHNKSNVTLAREVALALGIEEKLIKEVAEEFGGLPGRQEMVDEVNGVLYINDTNGTSPEAVIASLQSFPEYKGKVILLCGGSDKGLDYSEMAKVVVEYAKAVIVFSGTASDKILESFKIQNSLLPVGAAKLKIVPNVLKMHDAMLKAQELARPGDVVLLSPGAASFGVFKNEYDRGDQFVTEVKNIA